MSPSLAVPAEVREAFAPVLEALAPVRQALAGVKDVVSVRPGYHYPPSGPPVPAVVVAVTPGTSPVRAEDLAHRFHVPVSASDASVEEQMAPKARPASFAPGAASSPFEALLAGARGPVEFGPPRSGDYEPLVPPRLPLVDEKMKVTVCVSPEAGWTELEAFLGGTKERLTIAMYQFTAPHVFDAVRAAVSAPGRTLKLVLHPIPEPPPKSGTKADDLAEEAQVIAPLREGLGGRFRFSWATLKSRARPDGLWASAYHIKVAVRDGKAFWLSSGNWQSSNQPAVHLFGPKKAPPPAGLQRKYNRDYHAVIENEKLADAYEAYISRDHDLTAEAGAAVPFALPDLFLPDEVEAPVSFARPPEFFEPLRLERRVKVQPLLTPDNYAEQVLPLIRGAKKSVWFQNQYINYRGTGEDFAAFTDLVNALKGRIDAGRDVRIICRDLMKPESVDVLVALGVPRDRMRFQPACHNKTILIDGKVAVFGSHNWSNEGVKTNRDASLIFHDKEVAGYLGRVYEYDWERLAKARPTPPRVRVAGEGEATPKGHRRVPHSAVFED